MSKDGGSEEVSQEGAAAGGESSKKDTDIYENRGTKKIVRLITVMAYVFSVSFVAIVLSAYYLFLWEPPNPRLLRRPVHLSSEPEVQFLLSDQPVAMDEFNKHNSTVSHPSFSSRIAGMDDLADAYDTMGSHRGQLDDSLLILRKSLIEYLQNASNDSKYNEQELSREDWRISKPFNNTLTEKRKASNWTENSTGKGSKHSTMAIERTFENSSKSLTLDSSTISGDEANNNRFTGTRNNSVFKLPENSPRSNWNSGENVLIDRNMYKNNVSVNLTAKVRVLNKKVRSPIAEDSSNIQNITNEEPRFIIRISGEKNLESRENGNSDRYQSDKFKDIFNDVNEAAMNRQRSYESSVKLWKVALTLKDTHLEGTTNPSVTMPNEQNTSPETTTTETQKDLLTFLTKIADTSANSSSHIKATG